MKKRLSLLMVLMMIVSLLPMSAFALTGPNTTVKEVTTKNKSENFTVGFEKINGTFATENLRLTLVDKDGKKIGAEFAKTTNVVANPSGGLAGGSPISVPVGTSNEDEVLVTLPATTATVTNQTMDFTFTVDFTESDEGDVYLKMENTNINPSNTIFGNGTTAKIAVVKPYDGSKLAPTVKDAAKTVSLKGGALSEFYVSNLNAFNVSSNPNGAKTVVLSLDDMDWVGGANGTKVFDQFGNDITPAQISGKTLTLTIGNATGFRILPVVGEAGRKANFGDVVVYIDSFNGTTLVNTNRAVVGKLVDYAVTMEVVEKGKKAIPSLWGGEESTVKVTLKGPKGSLLNQRIDFKVEGADVKYGPVTYTGKNPSAPTEWTNVKNTTGIAGDPKAEKDKSMTVFKDKEFSINGTDFDKATEVSFEIVVVAAGNKDGVATITAMQRGLEVTTDLVKVTPKFAAKADVTPVKKGEAKDTATVTLTEAKAGLIQRGERITLSFDTKRDYVEHTTKGIKIEATNGMTFDTSSTGIKLVKDGNANGEVTLSILVDKTSTGEPAVITISGLNVAVDGSTTDDIVKLDAGLIERDNTTKASTSYTVSSIDYIKVVKEYDMESILSVFTIGQTAYTVNGETKAAHSAPYIKAGRTMLPIRAVAESLGLTVQWNSATRTASFTDASKVAAVTIGGKVMYVNGTPMPLTVPAELVNDTTFVELRSLATAFGVQIDWDAAAKTATVSK